PDAVVGHSQGEIAAACVAGGLSLEDAARVIALRSRALARLSGHGGMVSLVLSESELGVRLERFGGALSLAAINGPRSIAVSGERDALVDLLGWCEAEGVKGRELPVDYAAHSAQVEEIRDELLAACASVAPRSGDVPFYSSLTGGLLDTECLDAAYWYRNLRETARFEGAVRGLLEHGHRTFVEISPHPVLAMGLQETADDALEDASAGGGTGPGELTVVGSSRRDDGGASRFLLSLAEVWVSGLPVDWTSLLDRSSSQRVQLPTYAFQRQRYWLEPHSLTAGQEHPASLDADFWEAVEATDGDALAGMLSIGGDGVRSSLNALLPVLATWRAERARSSVVDEWRYRIQWKPVAEAHTLMLGDLWLVVAPAGWTDDEVIRGPIRMLQERGVRAVLLEVDGGAVEREALAGDLRDALRSSSPRELPADSLGGSLVVDGILSLLALDERPHPASAALTQGIVGSVTLVQALEDAGVGGRLWIATRGGVSVGSSDPLKSPVQAMMWGLGRVVGLEEPARWGGLVDLPADLDGWLWSRLCSVLGGSSDEDQLALRSSGVFARRLVRAPLAGRRVRRTWKPEGTTLITGGTGALGGHLARWLAREGARHIMLVSRSGSRASGATELVEELEALGAGVTISACDVADREQLRDLLAAIPEENPLEAVFHAAGVMADGPLRSMTTEQLERQLAAKAIGALNLSTLTERVDLQAFVLFSSVAGVLGAASQGGYAAANALLDGLAEHRRSRGLTATSVALGAWGDGEMDAAADYLDRYGLHVMTPESAIMGVRHALDHDEPQVIVADIDWERYAPVYTFARRRPLIEELPDVRRMLEAQGDAAPTAVGEEFARRVAEAPDGEREDLALGLVRDQVAATLGHPSGYTVDPQHTFMDLGFTSLLAVEFRNRLSVATGLRLPATLVFNYPTPAEIADYLLTRVASKTEATSGSVGAEIERLERIIAATSMEDGERAEAAARLQSLLLQLDGARGVEDSGAVAERIQSASAKEIMDLIDSELGGS
ncbi:MAG TPA: SDR family NAD(P)-dependent oxidoreductase, partial [Solirubrobacteraceae bacterium]|nr:SDR family NAD(P)-dependent oxidoreductase [Solirubrobacteraceae bacterium]